MGDGLGRLEGKNKQRAVAKREVSQPSRDTTTARAQSPSVIMWRTERLVAAGFDHELAVRVAADGGFDLHEMLELTDRGCPPKLAARIAAPPEGRAWIP